jgi:hypothetical protein
MYIQSCTCVQSSMWIRNKAEKWSKECSTNQAFSNPTSVHKHVYCTLLGRRTNTPCQVLPLQPCRHILWKEGLEGHLVDFLPYRTEPFPGGRGGLIWDLGDPRLMSPVPPPAVHNHHSIHIVIEQPRAALASALNAGTSLSECAWHCGRQDSSALGEADLCSTARGHARLQKADPPSVAIIRPLKKHALVQTAVAKLLHFSNELWNYY